jgi:hypothetical protein
MSGVRAVEHWFGNAAVLSLLQATGFAQVFGVDRVLGRLDLAVPNYPEFSNYNEGYLNGTI